MECGRGGPSTSQHGAAKGTRSLSETAMWKRILSVLGIASGIFILFFVIIALTHPEAISDFVFYHTDEFRIYAGGNEHTVKISRFEEGTGPADRVYLINKALALHNLSDGRQEYQEARELYCRELIEACRDGTLSSEENKRLREMFGDRVTDEMVSNWLRLTIDKKLRGKEGEAQGE